MWEGSIFSVYSREAADWEGTGYGPLLMTPAVPPLGPRARAPRPLPCCRAPAAGIPDPRPLQWLQHCASPPLLMARFPGTTPGRA